MSKWLNYMSNNYLYQASETSLPLLSSWNIIAIIFSLKDGRTANLKDLPLWKSMGKSWECSAENASAICPQHILWCARCLTPGCGQEMPHRPPSTAGPLAEPPGCGHMVTHRLVLLSRAFVLLLTWQAVHFWELLSSPSGIDVLFFNWLFFFAQIRR